MKTMRDNYEIEKIKIQAHCNYYGDYHELRIYFKNEDGFIIRNVSTYLLKDKGIIKKAPSFKKSQDFYDSDEGKEWLSQHLKEKDFEKERDNLLNKIRCGIYKLSLDELTKIVDYIEAFNKRSDNYDGLR